jgi:hypothetical protein
LTVLAFLAFALVAVVGPGIAVQRLVRVRADPSLAIPLGLLVAAGAYAAALLLGIPWLLPVLVLGLDLRLVVPLPKEEGGPPGGLGVVLPFLLVVLVLAVTEYPLNRPDARGDFLLDPVLPEDAAFHAGLTWELSHSYPPEVPGFSGRTMSYHFGLPLVRAAALRFAGIRPYDSLTRFDNTLGALALLLLLPAAVRAVGGTPTAMALAPWFLLSSDLSFLLAPGRGVPFWITSTKGSDLLFSLLQANATVPALALGLGAVVALGHLSRDGGRGWLVLALLLGLGTAFFKVFVAGQLLFGACAALVLSRERKAAGFLALLLCLVLGLLAFGPAGRGERLLLDPLVVLRDVRQALGLAPSTEAPPFSFVVFWILLSLGLRTLGLPSACRALVSGQAAGAVLAGMALSGWPLGLLLRISPLESPDRPQNEALYFFEQSGFLLWVFAAVAVGRWRLPDRWRLGALGGLVLLTLPSTAQFVLHKAALPPVRVPRGVVDAMTVVEATTRPGDVLMERPRMQRFPPPPMVFAGRRVPFASYLPFLTQWVPRSELEERRAIVQEFFRTQDAGRAGEIARELGARGMCLYGSDEVGFDTSGMREVVDSELVRVYVFPDYFTKR